jgi:hypothetical protein
MTALRDIRSEMGRWIAATSEHSSAVEAHDRPLSEAEELRGGELAEEAERLVDRAKTLGPAGIALAQAFDFLRNTWLRTGIAPTGLQESFGLAASLR